MNNLYLHDDNLYSFILKNGVVWLDTGQAEDLLEASKFIETIERRQGLKVACIEEIAFEKGYISREKLIEIANVMKNNQYGQYLLDL